MHPVDEVGTPQYEPSLYTLVKTHAERHPAKPALAYSGIELTYGQLLQEVGAAVARLEDQEHADWPVLQDNDKLAFAVDYLATDALSRGAILTERAEDATAVVPVLKRSGNELTALRIAKPDVLFTSGTTSGAKAVVIDGSEALKKAHDINAFFGNDTSLTEVVSLPLRHSFGLGRLRCALANGQSVRLTERLCAPQAVFNLIDTQARNGFAFVASTVKVLLNQTPELLAAHADSIAYLEIGSESLESRFRARLTDLLPATRIGLHYGMTELSRATMADLHDASVPRDSVGRPMPGVEIVTAGPGEREILARGTAMVRARVHAGGVEPLTRDAWLHTGDHGRIGPDGALTVTGRLGNVMKLLGKNVVLEETERSARAVVHVEECVCAAYELVPGVKILAALVEVTDGCHVDRSALHSELRRRLPAHQVPRQIWLTPRVPRLPNGKLDRRSAARMIEEFNAPGQGLGKR